MSYFPSLTLIVMIFSVKSEATEDGGVVVPSVPVSYNESLRLVAEAREDMNNVTRTINLISEDIARSVERQNEVRVYHQPHLGLTDDVQAVSVWVSWLMANSLCHGDLNMTGADILWRHSRSVVSLDIIKDSYIHGTVRIIKPKFTITIYSEN